MKNFLQESAFDIKCMRDEMRQINEKMEHVMDLVVFCIWQKRDRPGEKAVAYYRTLLPIISDTLDRAERILAMGVPETSMHIPPVLADIQSMISWLIWGRETIISWLDDDNGPSSSLPAVPLFPGGSKQCKPIIAV